MGEVAPGIGSTLPLPRPLAVGTIAVGMSSEGMSAAEGVGWFRVKKALGGGALGVGLGVVAVGVLEVVVVGADRDCCLVEAWSD